MRVITFLRIVTFLSGRYRVFYLLFLRIFLQEIIKNNTFESTTRYQAGTLQYPSIVQTTKMILLSKKPEICTDVLTLRRILSRSSCQEMKNLCEKGKYAAVTCDVGILTVESIDVLLKIHRVRDVKSDVQKQEKWLKKEISVPNATCSLSKGHRATYADKILNTPNNYSVLENNRCILASDLAIIAGSGWLNYSILNGMAEMLHKENEHTAALLLNNIILVDDDDLLEYVKSNFRCSTK